MTSAEIEEQNQPTSMPSVVKVHCKGHEPAFLNNDIYIAGGLLL